MRGLVASSVTISAAFAASANAYFDIASNVPLPPQFDDGNGFWVQDGNYSDALSSDGEYFNGLGLAQGFSTAAGYTMDRLTVWGNSDNFGSNTPWTTTALSSNIVGFQVVLMKQNALGAYVTEHAWNIGIASVVQTMTGNYSPNTFNPVFQLSMDLSGGFALTEGIHYLAVGAILANGDGDSWRWTNGEWDGLDSSHPYIATTADTPTSWGQWAGVPTGVSGAMLLQSNIPGPAASLIFAAGALVRGSRRRR